MKKNINVIQVKGIRGILLVCFLVCCLISGFIVFPGWLAMSIWNYSCNYFVQIPHIGIIQGMLLWGITAISYYTFRKEKLIVLMKSSEELSDEELKSVFANVKKQAQQDVFINSIIKARQAELKINNLQQNNITMPDNKITKNKTDSQEKIETK